jgi:DNA-binding NarL/FixJ family response regulator
MLAAGHPNKVIARQLEISPNTVKTHISRIFEKLEVANRTQAIRRARELDILP